MTYYDDIAEGYEELHEEEQVKKLQLIAKHLDLRSSDRLLDVGCGPYFGNFPCHVTGIDPSEKLIELAKKKGIEAVVGKAESLPFPDDSFDVVVSLTAIQNFDDITQGLSEIRRVGKRFVLTFLKRSDKRDTIETALQELFAIDTILEEEKDMIYFCSK